MLRWCALVAALVLASSSMGVASSCASIPGRQGCCSHHGGVCGCNAGTGMQRCCDGADSPSCRCGE